MIVSNVREVMFEGKDKGLSIVEVFYLVIFGGVVVCCFEDKIGSFEVGKDFDGLIIGIKGVD